MGSGLVSDLDADKGSDTNRSPLTYTEIFETECPFYLSIGVTVEQYWDGDPKIAEWYRKAFELKNDRKNEELWLQGMYIYAALCEVSPVLHAFARRGTKPGDYLDAPIPITKNAIRKKKEEEAKKNMEDMKNKFLRFMSVFNTSQKEVKDNGRLSN